MFIRFHLLYPLIHFQIKFTNRCLQRVNFQRELRTGGDFPYLKSLVAGCVVEIDIPSTTVGTIVRVATKKRKSRHRKPYFIIKSRCKGHLAVSSAHLPLCKLFERRRSAKGPVGGAGRVAETDIPSTTGGTTARGATKKRKSHNCIIYIKEVPAISCA